MPPPVPVYRDDLGDPYDSPRPMRSVLGSNPRTTASVPPSNVANPLHQVPAAWTSRIHTDRHNLPRSEPRSPFTPHVASMDANRAREFERLSQIQQESQRRGLIEVATINFAQARAARASTDISYSDFISGRRGMRRGSAPAQPSVQSPEPADSASTDSDPESVGEADNIFLANSGYSPVPFLSQDELSLESISIGPFPPMDVSGTGEAPLRIVRSQEYSIEFGTVNNGHESSTNLGIPRAPLVTSDNRPQHSTGWGLRPPPCPTEEIRRVRHEGHCSHETPHISWKETPTPQDHGS